MLLIDFEVLFGAFVHFGVILVFVFLDDFFMMFFHFGDVLLELPDGYFQADDFIVEGVDFVDVADGLHSMVLDLFLVLFEFAAEHQHLFFHFFP